MLVTLGFLSATLMALAAVPALARRADRLARRRAEAAFPLSLAEIAADRDHLRAELALRERALEQQAERGFQAKAAAMQEAGRRDMENAALKREIAGRSRRHRRARSRSGDDARRRSPQTREALAERAGGASRDRRHARSRASPISPSVEQALAEARASAEAARAPISPRATTSWPALRETLERERGDARRAGAASSRPCAARPTALRVALVEGRTQHLVLEAKRDELVWQLAASEAALACASAPRDRRRQLRCTSRCASVTSGSRCCMPRSRRCRARWRSRARTGCS